MILIPFQAALMALITAYMVYSAAEQFQRNHRSWQAIVSRLSFDWDAGMAWGSPSLEKPWIAFRDAGIMMEMADYIERHAREFDAAALDSLRATALQLRFQSLRALTRLLRSR
jgi:hypothetical protein